MLILEKKQIEIRKFWDAFAITEKMLEGWRNRDTDNKINKDKKNTLSGFGGRFHFCRPKIKKSLEMVQFPVLFHTFPPLMIFVCFGITKTEMAAKTAPRVPKLG